MLNHQRVDWRRWQRSRHIGDAEGPLGAPQGEGSGQDNGGPRRGFRNWLRYKWNFTPFVLREHDFIVLNGLFQYTLPEG